MGRVKKKLIFQKKNPEKTKVLTETTQIEFCQFSGSSSAQQVELHVKAVKHDQSYTLINKFLQRGFTLLIRLNGIEVEINLLSTATYGKMETFMQIFSLKTCHFLLRETKVLPVLINYRFHQVNSYRTPK